MTGVVPAWIVALALITYRDMKKGSKNNIGGLPLPADYLASFVIYGVLSIPQGEGRKPATVAAWGFTLAIFMNLFPATIAPKGGTQAAAPAATTQKAA